MKKTLVAAVMAFLVSCVLRSAIAQDLEKGRAAYLRGDYKTALKELAPLGEQGNAEAQSNLGLIKGK